MAVAHKRRGCGNGRNLGQRLAAQSLGLDGEPAPIVVREPETLAPKPGSEHTVLLLQVVDHILLLAVDPARTSSRNCTWYVIMELKITPSARRLYSLRPLARSQTQTLSC